MKKLNASIQLIDLSEFEQKNIEGGSEREDSKRSGWFNAMWEKIIGVGF